MSQQHGGQQHGGRFGQRSVIPPAKHAQDSFVGTELLMPARHSRAPLRVLRVLREIDAIDSLAACRTQLVLLRPFLNWDWPVAVEIFYSRIRLMELPFSANPTRSRHTTDASRYTVPTFESGPSPTGFHGTLC
jgi:hypothetical protein